MTETRVRGATITWPDRMGAGWYLCVLKIGKVNLQHQVEFELISRLQGEVESHVHSPHGSMESQRHQLMRV